MQLPPFLGKREFTWLLVALTFVVAIFVGRSVGEKAFPSPLTLGVISPNGIAPALSAQSFPMVAPTLKYGVAVDTFAVRSAEIKAGETLSDLLGDLGANRQEAYELSNTFDELLSVRQLRAGKRYTVLDDPETRGADYFIYQPSIYEYVRLDLHGNGADERVKLPVQTSVALAGGSIESNLWNAMTGAGMSFELTDRMEDALQWSVDFHHVQPNDAFQLVYEKNLIEGEVEAAPGKVLAARYSSGGEDVYAFWYDSADTTLTGYYGLNGEPMKSAFLKSPVRFSRVSSAYNLKRFHPVLKRRRPHLGTDYAAPYGTPILSVADGVIVARTRRGGNGNFVKVKHDDTYTTQYLHMQKFADGQRVGSRVQQGDVIGYVGSTGLATGPHTCFRFWKNGKQIDHTKLKFPPARTMPDTLMPNFVEVRDAFLRQLNERGAPRQDTEQQIADGIRRMRELRELRKAK